MNDNDGSIHVCLMRELLQHQPSRTRFTFYDIWFIYQKKFLLIIFNLNFHINQKKIRHIRKRIYVNFSEKELNENTFHSQFCDKTSERTMTKLRLHTWGNVTQIHS